MKSVFFIVLLFFNKMLTSQIVTGKIDNKNERVVKFFYKKKLSIIEDSVFVNEKGHFKKRFKFKSGTFVTMKYETKSKLLFLYPGFDVVIYFDFGSDIIYSNSFFIKGDYGINKYLNADVEQKMRNYFNSRIDLTKPIEQFKYLIDSFTIYSSNLRQSFFENKDFQKNYLSQFMLIDSVKWHYYAVLLANDYLGLYKFGNKNLFINDVVRGNLIFNDKYLTAEYYNKMWIFLLKNFYLYDTVFKKNISNEKQDFPAYVLNYIKVNNIKGLLESQIISQLLFDISS